MAAGFYAILEVVHASASTFWHLDNAAKAIGFAVLFDGLDGRVARMTGTSSEFGKELDSLADVITFGVAPAMLAWTWGFHLMPPVGLTDWDLNIKLTQLGAIAAFLFLMAGASRLARFNIYFEPHSLRIRAGQGRNILLALPIPAGAGVVAAVVHFQSGVPLDSWYKAIPWLAMVAAVGYLMVSTWRFYSFKDIDFSSRHPFRLIILFGALIAGLWFFSKPVLFGVALLYTFSGVFWRPAMDLPSAEAASAAHLQGGFADFMSSPSKIAAPPSSSSARGQLFRAAIVGAGTLKGKEVAEMPARAISLRSTCACWMMTSHRPARSHWRRGQFHPERARRAVHKCGLYVLCRRCWIHPRELDARPRCRQCDYRSLRRIGRGSGRDGSFSLGGARTWPDVATGAGAGSLRGGSSRSRDPGAPAVAGSQRLALSAAPWQRFSSPPPNRDRKEWTNCTSRPLICCHSSRCPRMSLMHRWRSYVGTLRAELEVVARFAGDARPAPTIKNLPEPMRRSPRSWRFSLPCFMATR